MNALDILVLGVIILSALFAFARGFVRECLSISNWLGATAAALYAGPLLRPLAEHFVPKGAFADAAAAGTAFIATLVVLTVVTGAISRRVQRSSLSALDRTLGLVFGLMRGALLVCIGFLALSFVLPPKGERPRWLAQSRTAPLFAAVTQDLVRLVPAPFRQRAAQFSPQEHLQRDFENALRAYAIPSVPQAAGAGPSSQDQQRLNQLFQQLGTGSPEPPPQTQGGERVIQVPPASGGR
jgi:membrane protein required for colicin V production